MVVNIIFGGLLLYGGVVALLYFFQERILFHPQSLDRDYHFDFGTGSGFEEIFITAPDKSRLHALLFSQTDPLGIILYFHGNAGSLAGWGWVSNDLLPYGYEILIPDFRGYGKSSGKLSEAKLFSDAQLWYELCQSRFPEEKILIYGRSLGTGMATQIASLNRPNRLLLENPFYNMAELAKKHFPGFPHHQLLRYPFRNDRYIQEIQCPIFVVHGTADEVVPYESGKRLVTSRDQDVRFWTINGGGHNNLSTYPDYYRFLKEALNNPIETGEIEAY